MMHITRVLTLTLVFSLIMLSCTGSGSSNSIQSNDIDTVSNVWGIIYHDGIYNGDTVESGDWEGYLSLKESINDTSIYDASWLFERIRFEYCRTFVSGVLSPELFKGAMFRLIEIDGKIDYQLYGLDCIEQLKISTTWIADTMVFDMRIEKSGTTYYDKGKWLISTP